MRPRESRTGTIFGAGGSAGTVPTRILSGYAASVFVVMIGLHCVPTSTYFTTCVCVCTVFDPNAGVVGFEGRRDEDGEAGDE
jgi:hypothetical protein